MLKISNSHKRSNWRSRVNCGKTVLRVKEDLVESARGTLDGSPKEKEELKKKEEKPAARKVGDREE